MIRTGITEQLLIESVLFSREMHPKSHERWCAFRMDYVYDVRGELIDYEEFVIKNFYDMEVDPILVSS